VGAGAHRVIPFQWLKFPSDVDPHATPLIPVSPHCTAAGPARGEGGRGPGTSLTGPGLQQERPDGADPAWVSGPAAGWRGFTIHPSVESCTDEVVHGFNPIANPPKRVPSSR